MDASALRAGIDMDFHGKGGAAALTGCFMTAAFTQLVPFDAVTGFADTFNQVPGLRQTGRQGRAFQENRSLNIRT